MVILILLQMAYHLIGDSLHSWGGMMLFILIALHNIADRKWYSGLRKGKYTPLRFFHTVINFLLLASFLGLAVSAAFLSTTLSTFLRWNMTLTGRRMHMLFSIWSFVLMSVHAGLHLSKGSSVIKKQGKKIQSLFKMILIFASAYGSYAFISRGLLQQMFLVSEYVFVNYEEPVFLVIIDYAAIVCLFSCVSFVLRQMIVKQK